MTNREHYREQIIDICAKGMRPIICADGLTGCSSRDCSGCSSWYKSQNFFGTGFSCRVQENFTKWLEEEYKLYVTEGASKCMEIRQIIQTGDRVNDRT